jgi:hypothetical protein
VLSITTNALVVCQDHTTVGCWLKGKNNSFILANIGLDSRWNFYCAKLHGFLPQLNSKFQIPKKSIYIVGAQLYALLDTFDMHFCNNSVCFYTIQYISGTDGVGGYIIVPTTIFMQSQRNKLFSAPWPWILYVP